MKCREVRSALVAYLDNEIMPSERTLIEAHLAGCGSCERELSALGSSRRRLTDSLKTLAAQAAPSRQALSHLQARLVEEVRTPPHRLTGWVTRSAPDERPATRFYRQGDHRMKKRWRIAFGTIGAIVIAAGVIALVPSTRAAAGEFFADVFSISSEDPPLQLGYLPEGFDSQPLYQTGAFRADTEPDAAGMGSASLQEQESLYQEGDRFLLVKTSVGVDAPLPEGQATDVGGVPAVLRTGLSGVLEPSVPDLGQDEPTSGAEDAGPSPNDEVIESWVSGGLDEKGNTWKSSGTESEIPSITYDNANAVTWDADGTRVEILSNLPVDELLKVAEGLVLDE